jgi:alpha-galactosidase
VAISNSSAFNEDSKESRDMGIRASMQRPIKMVFIGAGSGFLYQLFKDALNIPGVGGEIALVDIDEYRLDLAIRFCKKVNEVMGRNWKVYGSTDRRKVMKGAHYVVNTVEVSGMLTVKLDNDIPAKYGVSQSIGDTMGPGGLFKTLRTGPVLIEIMRDIEKYCPQATFLNYTNPMSAMCLIAARMFPHIKTIGFCHSVQGTSHKLADFAGIDYRKLKWRVAGINHLAWFTELSCDGKDLYPQLKAQYRRNPEKYLEETVRMDVMCEFGYFVTESSQHLSEYLPYYRKRPDILKKYGPTPSYAGGHYARSWPKGRNKRDVVREAMIAGKKPIVQERSWEYASFLIQAMETNDPFIVAGNVPNKPGLIDNLPREGIVEVPCVIDQTGIHPTHFGPLPPQCAAISASNMRFFDLAAQAVIDHSKEMAIHALMLDPLTAAVSYPAQIRKMAEELFKAEKKFLPGYK